MRCRFILAPLLVPLLLPPPVAAQQPVQQGEWIRVATKAAPNDRIEGTLIAYADDSVSISVTDPVRTQASGRPAMRTETIARDDLATVMVRRTVGNRAMRGMAIGGGAGLLLGLGIGLAASGEDGGIYETSSTDVVNAGLVLGGIGAVAGLVAGAATKQYSWEPAGLEGAPVVSMQRDGVRIGWSRSF